MSTIIKHFWALCLLLGSFTFPVLSYALVIETTINGSDAIWLAGRVDLTIPEPNQPWPGGLLRHGRATPEEIKETLPTTFPVVADDVIRVLDPAEGGISFFNGYGGRIYGPQGNGVPGSSRISAYGGISGYLGTQGALVGVFLDDSIPSGAPPSTLDFSLLGLGVDFMSIEPELGQIFFIGDGVTAGGAFQEFVAPLGSTRVAFGITDAFGFNGAPGAFDDNDGFYSIKVGINERPDRPTTSVSEPTSIGLIFSGLLFLVFRRRCS